MAAAAGVRPHGPTRRAVRETDFPSKCTCHRLGWSDSTVKSPQPQGQRRLTVRYLRLIQSSPALMTSNPGNTSTKIERSFAESSRRVFVAAIVQNSQVAPDEKGNEVFRDPGLRRRAGLSVVWYTSLQSNAQAHREQSPGCVRPEETSACGESAPPWEPATERNGSAPPRPRPWCARFSSLARPPSSSSFVPKRYASALLTAKIRYFAPRGQAPLEPPKE